MSDSASRIPELAVVLPTYNEANNLEAMIEALLDLPLDLHVFVVDDNSPDGTGQLADELARRHAPSVTVIHRDEKKGLGRAYKHGFQQAYLSGAPFIAQMDCDFSHSPGYLPTMVEMLKTTESDVVVGSRYVPGGGLDERWSWWREGLSLWANFYSRTILRLRVRDATAGFKVWRRATLEAIDLERVVSNGYVFQVEMSYLTQKLGFVPFELPIYFEDRRIGRSKMDVPVKIEAAYRVLELLWRHRHVEALKREALKR